MKFSVGKDEKGYSFVAGNTKFLKDMAQQELAILAENGDTRVKAEETEEPKGVKPAKPAASPAPSV